jgi:hypothetical protein
MTNALKHKYTEIKLALAGPATAAAEEMANGQDQAKSPATPGWSAAAMFSAVR